MKNITAKSINPSSLTTKHTAMSAKGTTWTKADKVISVKFQQKPDELPQWVYRLIDTLSAEIQLLQKELKTIKNDNSNRMRNDAQ